MLAVLLRLFVCLLLLRGGFASLHAEARDVEGVDAPISVQENFEKLEIGDRIAVFEDRTGSLSFSEIVNVENARSFMRSLNRVPNFGYSRSAYWIRIEVENASLTKKNLYLDLGFAHISEVQLYQNSNGGPFHARSTGKDKPFFEREIEHRNLVFPLEFEGNSKSFIYLRLKTLDALRLPIALYSHEKFVVEDAKSNLALGAYFGLIAVMVAYNFFLFLSTKDRLYLHYVFCQFSIHFLYQLSVLGLGYQFLWPAYPGFERIANLTLAAVSLVTSTRFTMVLLDTSQTLPRINKVLWVHVFCGVFVAMASVGFEPESVFGSFVIGLGVASAPLCSIITLIGSVLLVRAGSRTAKLFLGSWGLFLCSLIVTSLMAQGVLPRNFFTEYAPLLGGAQECVLMSFVLGDRINQTRVAHLRAQETLLNELRRLDKLKDEFLANTSHELRTPLSGIIGIAESLIDGVTGELPLATRQNLELVVASGRRLNNLVNDILDFTRLRSHDLHLQIRPVSLRGIVNVCFSLCGAALHPGTVQLVNDIPEDLTVDADEDRLQQILINLVGNAVKFTSEGTIVVSASPVKGDPDTVMILVKDTGIGIPEADLERIFESFEQVDGSHTRRFGGVGLGLSVTRKLVELHGGRIWCESQVGVGSRFCFLLSKAKALPAAKRTEEKTQKNVRPRLELELPSLSHGSAFQENRAIAIPSGNRGPEASSRLRILIVEDEPINLQVLANQLSMENYDVLQASNGKEALKVLEHTAKPNLVIMDVMMPEMTGFETCLKMREKFTSFELPIILLTAKAQMEALVEGFQCGANDFLTKPFSRLELRSRIQAHLTLSRTSEALQQAIRRLDCVLHVTQQLTQKEEPESALQALGGVLFSELPLSDSTAQLILYLREPWEPGDFTHLAMKFQSHQVETLEVRSTAAVAAIEKGKKQFPQTVISGKRATQDGIWRPLLGQTLNVVQTGKGMIVPLGDPLRPDGLLEIRGLAFEKLQHVDEEFCATVGLSLHLALQNLRAVRQRIETEAKIASARLNELGRVALKPCCDVHRTEVFGEIQIVCFVQRTSRNAGHCIVRSPSTKTKALKEL